MLALPRLPASVHGHREYHLYRNELPLSPWLLAMHLSTPAKNNLSVLEMKRPVGMGCRAAWLVKHTLLQVRAGEAERRLSGCGDR